LTTAGLREFLLSTSGDVGLLAIDLNGATELDQILYSPDGQAWTNTDVPPEMRDVEPTIDAFYGPVTAVATDTSFIVLLNTPSEGEREPSSTLVWFLGTPITD
jgi:hypothetical protein